MVYNGINRGSISVYYPNAVTAVLLLRASFKPSSAHYTLYGHRRYTEAPVLDFIIERDGHRIDLTLPDIDDTQTLGEA